MPAIRCSHVMPNGALCRAYSQASGRCYFHDPQTSDQAAEGRRTGGLHRRRNDATVAGFYDFSGLRTLEDCLGLLERVAFDTLPMDASSARSRMLIQTARESARIIEKGELKDALERLQQVLRPREPGTTDPLGEDDDEHH